MLISEISLSHKHELLLGVVGDGVGEGIGTTRRAQIRASSEGNGAAAIGAVIGLAGGAAVGAPGLSFLNVLLGDEPVLSPQAQYYQRLLATENEARQVLERYLKKEKSLEDLYSSVVIPALSLAEQDRHRNELDEETQNFIYQSTREIVEELADTFPEQDAEGTAQNPSELSRTERKTGRVDVLCIPARDDADDVVAMLLSQLLERKGHRAESISIGTTPEMLSQVQDANLNVVCISALPPFAVNHARALYTKLHTQSPDLHIVVCVWQFEGDPQKAAIRLKLATGHGFFTTLPQVLQHIAFRSTTIAPGANEPSAQTSSFNIGKL
jgi:hypothetical protein